MIKMIEKYKSMMSDIKKAAYIAGGTILVSAVLSTGVFAQQGTIEEKVNDNISPSVKITENAKVNEESENPYQELSDEINLNFHEQMPNYVKIGVWEGYEKKVDGQTLCFVDGFDYAFLKLEIKSDETPDFASCANYGIENKIKGVASALKYNKKDALLFMASVTKKGEGIYTVYVKTNIKNKE